MIGAFTASVTATRAGLSDLKALLAQERECLIGADPAALQAVVDRKVEALSRVEQALRQADDLLTGADYERGVRGGDRLLQTRAHPAELAADWHALKALSRQVASMNSANGHLLNQARSDNRAALSAITGRTQDPGAYDKRGQDQSKLPGYELGEA